MWAAILVTVMAAILLIRPATTNWTTIFAAASRSVAPLQLTPPHEDWYGRPYKTICSAVNVETFPRVLFITEGHCVLEGHVQELAIEGAQATVVWFDKDRDLVLLQVSRADLNPRWWPMFFRNTSPRPGTPVGAIGYAFGVDAPTFSLGTVAHVPSTDDPAFQVMMQQMGIPSFRVPVLMFSLAVWGGHSGGIIVDAKGHGITLVRMGGVTDSYSAPSEVIWKFLQDAKARVRLMPLR